MLMWHAVLLGQYPKDPLSRDATKRDRRCNITVTASGMRGKLDGDRSAKAEYRSLIGEGPRSTSFNVGLNYRNEIALIEGLYLIRCHGLPIFNYVLHAFRIFLA